MALSLALFHSLISKAIRRNFIPKFLRSAILMIDTGLDSSPSSIASKQLTEQHKQDPSALPTVNSAITIRNVEQRRWSQFWRKNTEQLHDPVCRLSLPDAAKGWQGPRIKMSLPSFRCVAARSRVCWMNCLYSC